MTEEEKLGAQAALAGEPRPVKHMPLADFVRLGYLQELNRLFLHPLGLALEVTVDEYGMPTGFGEIWDARSDQEGMLFDDLSGKESAAKAAYIDREMASKSTSRTEIFGFVIQPIGHKADGHPRPLTPEEQDAFVEQAVKPSPFVDEEPKPLKSG